MPHATPNPRRGGRRHGAGRKPGSKNKPKTAAPIVADFEAGILPLAYMQSEMERFIKMGNEDAAREARTIAISIMKFIHPTLAAKQVHSIHDVGDRLDALLRHLDGRPTNKNSRAMGRPAGGSTTYTGSRTNPARRSSFGRIGRKRTFWTICTNAI